MNKPTSKPQIVETRILLQIVGAIAFLLPFALILFAYLLHDKEIFRSSISHYFYSNSHVAFVGCLSAVSMFFFAYVGYKSTDEELKTAKFLNRMSDQSLATLIAVFAAFVAIFPTTPKNPTAKDEYLATVHFASAALFLILLAYMAINRFTKSNKPAIELKGTPKAKRNLVYRICGWIMLVSVAVMAIYFFATSQETQAQQKYVIFIGETICLLAFGVAWVIKGELMIKDY